MVRNVTRGVELGLCGCTWTELTWLIIGRSGRLCEHGNEPLDFIKCGEYLDQLWSYKLFKNNSSPRSFIAFTFTYLLHCSFANGIFVLCHVSHLMLGPPTY
jgi:hypothetical protein